MVVPTLAGALLGLALLAACSGGDGAGAAKATVERIVDGDTLVLADGRRVRLVQIDAPEEDDGECYAAEAAEALAGVVPPGSTVELETDPALDDVDRFDRLLRYVVRDGVYANLELVRSGAAAPWFYDGDRGRLAGELLQAAEQAKGERRGLWGACPGATLDPTRGLETGG
jgi:endonuclease YncB( thermonuclease family)